MREGLSALERPFAVDLAAGDTLDLLRIVPEGDGIVHVAADPALFVAEGGGWLDLADQSPLRPAPHQSGPVAQLVQRQSQRLDRQRPVTFVESGSKLILSPYVVHRDPAYYPDPLRFDIHRKPKRILSFGAGPHHCVGNILGRTTITTAIRRLLERFPKARMIDPNFTPVYGGAVGELRLQSLPMRIH